MTVVLLLGAMLLSSSGRVEDPRATSLASEVLALASRGDAIRLAQAIALVPAPLLSDPGHRAAAANRALAVLLSAATLREVSAASPGGEEGLRRARALREEALDELRPLVRAFPEDPSVARALAVYLGLGGRAGELAAVAREARQDGRSDPWIDFAEVSAAVRGKAPGEAAPLLSRFVEDHPGILPPRMSLARAQLALGDQDAALATLDGLLATDPDHEDAKQLKAELLAPPPVRMKTPVVPSSVPPPSAPGFLPRKKPRAGIAPTRRWRPRCAAWRRGDRTRRTW